MYKKVLVLGNGFDLAHGLPTSYSNFIEFITLLDNDESGAVINKYLLENSDFKLYNIDLIDITRLKKKYKSVELNIEGKGLLEYLKLTKNLEKWVDFENEILKILRLFQIFNKILDKNQLIRKDNIYQISFEYEEMKNDEIREYNKC